MPATDCDLIKYLNEEYDGESIHKLEKIVGNLPAGACGGHIIKLFLEAYTEKEKYRKMALQYLMEREVSKVYKEEYEKIAREKIKAQLEKAKEQVEREFIGELNRRLREEGDTK